MKVKPIKAPFPYFGGKSKVATEVLSRLGSTANYVEPFAGSLAVLLANSNPPKIETVNDKNCFLSNFWRAVQSDPNAVAHYADYPVNQTDLHARQHWLNSAATDDFRKRMDTDPDYFDAKIAGYWVWGIGASIGNNWLSSKGLNAMPILSSAGGGIHGLTHTIEEWFGALHTRLRRVRVACGDWTKVVTPSITFKNKGLSPKDITAVFLDPPYEFEKRHQVYQEENNIFTEVRQWAIDNGANPQLRIALCGYDDYHTFPEGWSKFTWQANGGLANLGNQQGQQNKKLETIWFSPHCL